MDQGSASWLSWKEDKIGSSDSAVVFNASEWMTPITLCKRLSGKPYEKQKRNPYMDRGNRFEPKARARFELKHDMDFPAEIVVHPKYKRIIASLDGRNKDAKAVLEIKVPNLKVFNAAKVGSIEDGPKDKIKYKRFVKEWRIREHCEGEGICHPKYYCQVQHQMMCAQAEICYFYVCLVDWVHGQEQIIDDALVIVHADPEFQQELLFKELQMIDFANRGIQPPLTDMDVVELDDQSSVILFSEIKRLKLEHEAATALLQQTKEKFDEIDAKFEEYKADLIEHVSTFEQQHTRYSCLGVNMTKSKKGHWIIRLDRSEHSDELPSIA
jgi:putative phage-type endonuclease